MSWCEKTIIAEREQTVTPLSRETPLLDVPRGSGVHVLFWHNVLSIQWFPVCKVLLLLRPQGEVNRLAIRTGNFCKMGTTNSLVNLWELQLARDVQNRLFPAARPSIPGLDYYSDWRPASITSGDYLDYFEMDEGNLGLAIGDVGGRGLQAALLTASLHSIVRALRFSQQGSLGEFVSTIDELFSEIAPDN